MKNRKFLLVLLLGLLFSVVGCKSENKYKYTVWIGSWGYYTDNYEIKDRLIYFQKKDGKNIISDNFRINEN